MGEGGGEFKSQASDALPPYSAAVRGSPRSSHASSRSISLGLGPLASSVLGSSLAVDWSRIAVPTGVSADAEYIGGTVGVGQVGCIGRRRCMVNTALVPAAARTSGAVTTHMSFLLGLFDAKRAQVGCSGGQRFGPLVTEAAARFVFRCTASANSERSEKLATKHTFTLCTRWHSLPTPIESQELLAGLVDPWNAPVWTRSSDPRLCCQLTTPRCAK